MWSLFWVFLWAFWPTRVSDEKEAVALLNDLWAALQLAGLEARFSWDMAARLLGAGVLLDTEEAAIRKALGLAKKAESLGIAYDELVYAPIHELLGENVGRLAEKTAQPYPLLRKIWEWAE